jgi:hypothetical protein
MKNGFTLFQILIAEIDRSFDGEVFNSVPGYSRCVRLAKKIARVTGGDLDEIFFAAFTAAECAAPYDSNDFASIFFADRN